MSLGARTTDNSSEPLSSVTVRAPHKPYIRDGAFFVPSLQGSMVSDGIMGRFG